VQSAFAQEKNKAYRRGAARRVATVKKKGEAPPSFKRVGTTRNSIKNDSSSDETIKW
jgi:hypothetical protein